MYPVHIILFFFMSNISFAHSRIYSKIYFLYGLFSLRRQNVSTCKMSNWKHNEFELEDNLIANSKSFYNIKIFNRLLEKKYVIFIELCMKGNVSCTP
jgi:hypothetical protein